MEQNKSMLDVAYEIMSKAKGVMTFADLYAQVVAILEMNEDDKNSHLGEFYTELTLDGRFVAFTDNTWDLRARHTYAKVHIDANEVYSDLEESDEDAEDVQEEKEYNAEIEGKALPDGTPDQSEESDSEDKPNIDADVASLVGK